MFRICTFVHVVVCMKKDKMLYLQILKTLKKEWIQFP